MSIKDITRRGDKPRYASKRERRALRRSTSKKKRGHRAN